MSGHIDHVVPLSPSGARAVNVRNDFSWSICPQGADPWGRFKGRNTKSRRQNIEKLRHSSKGAHMAEYQFIDSKQLASRWNVPETWVRERVRRRAEDPLPHVRFGKYVRFRWGSPELDAWAERRIVAANNRDMGRGRGKENQ